MHFSVEKVPFEMKGFSHANNVNLRRSSIIIKVPKNSPRALNNRQVRLPKMSQIEYLDLSDQSPVKPSFIVVNFPDFLTPPEYNEINSYKEIYYVRRKRPNTNLNSKSALKPSANFVKIGNFFKFEKEDHIAFRYEQIQVLGKGAFGNVIKCYDHKTKQFVAIKMLRDKPKLHSAVMFELKLLIKLQGSDQIIKYIDSFQFRGFFCIVMELMGKDVYTTLVERKYFPYSLETTQMVAKETANGLLFMHNSGIIHCDIKPENLIFDESMKIVKIIDFGCSCYVGKLMYSYIQSRYYRAPEVVFGMQYSTPIDLWSLGCVICEMLTGIPLFPAEDENELVNQICEIRGLPPRSFLKKGPRAKIYFNMEDGTLKSYQNSRGRKYEAGKRSIREVTKIKDNELLDLIEKCLVWDPTERITAEQFLNHPWITKMDESSF